MAFEIFEDQFYSGMFEVEAQNANVFNEQSSGTINTVPREHIGDFAQEAFFQEEANTVTRRDITSNSAVTPSELDSVDRVGVKLYRKSVFEKKLTDIKRIGYTPEQYSFIVGQQIAKSKMVDMLNTGLIGLTTAIATESGQVDDITAESPNTANYDAIPGTLQLFGDAAPRLRHVLGHSKPIHDLLGDSFTVETDNVAGTGINNGSIPSLGRTLSMTDSGSLITADGVSSGVDSYSTLFLAENALVLEQSEQEIMHSEIVSLKENLTVVIQVEWAYTLFVKGFTFDETSGANPADAALGTAGNWSLVASDKRNSAGVSLVSA